MIATYNATTTVQCIFKNIPTIIFLDKRFYNLQIKLNQIMKNLESWEFF